MIVQSNTLCSRLLNVSCRLSATSLEVFCSNQTPGRRAYATRISSHFRKNTILQDSSQAPASTCWSLLSPSSSVITSTIASLKLRKAKLTSGRTPLVVLLVTPAHIRLLDDDSTFIPALLQLAVESTWSWQGFDLLAAVVDGIPRTSSTASYRPQRSHAADVDSSPETWAEDGFEGISVAVLDSEAAAPDLWSPKDISNERETMTIQQRCTLAFSLHPGPGVRTQLSDKSASQPLVERMLQLPVANTIFQNGKTATLFAQRWEVKFRKESTPEHMSSMKTWLPQQTVNMSSIFTNEGMRLRLDHLVNSHLVPITPARTITAAVGNIVRKISGDDALAEVVPASEELEGAISNAIQQGHIPAQQTGVWALIRPQRYAALDRAAQGTARNMIEYAILSGARLHKVLSGGGGWGEKHGLLALDPDSDYNHRPRAFETSFGDDHDVEAQRREGLGEVAKPGDSITFYVYRSPSDASPADFHTPVFWNSGQAATATLNFGSLPSTVDSIREVDANEAEAHARSELMVEENYFGMLSEQGMSLESSFLNTNVPANRMQYLRPELHRQIYEVRRRNTVTTKLDAPYTLLSIRGQSSRLPTSSEVKGEELHALNVDLQNLMPPEPPTATSTYKSVAALVRKLPKIDDQKQETQQSVGYKYLQADRVFAKTQEARKEQRARASKVRLEAAKETKTIAEQHPGISEKTARKRARNAVAGEIEQGVYKLQGFANGSAEEAMSEYRKVHMIRQNNHNGGKRGDDHTFTIRITSRALGAYGKATLQPEVEEPQDALPGLIRRHPSIRPSDIYQTHMALPIRKLNVDIKRESESLPDDVEYETKLDSVPIIRVESEGKDPGTAYKGKEDNRFMLRKHFTMNPFERLQAIRRVGEITSREQAMGLHSQYHLALEDQLGEVRKT